MVFKHLALLPLYRKGVKKGYIKSVQRDGQIAWFITKDAPQKYRDLGQHLSGILSTLYGIASMLKLMCASMVILLVSEHLGWIQL